MRRTDWCSTTCQDPTCPGTSKGCATRRQKARRTWRGRRGGSPSCAVGMCVTEARRPVQSSQGPAVPPTHDAHGVLAFGHYLRYKTKHSRLTTSNLKPSTAPSNVQNNPSTFQDQTHAPNSSMFQSRALPTRGSQVHPLQPSAPPRWQGCGRDRHHSASPGRHWHRPRQPQCIRRRQSGCC